VVAGLGMVVGSGTFFPAGRASWLMTRDGRSAQAAAAGTGLDQEGVMSSLMVRIGAVSAALAGLLITGQEARALPTGGVVAEGRAESAAHTGQPIR
jgi:hypothetical protein